MAIVARTMSIVATLKGMVKYDAIDVYAAALGIVDGVVAVDVVAAYNMVFH